MPDLLEAIELVHSIERVLLGIFVLGTLNFAAPAQAATYYYGMTQSNNGNGDGGGDPPKNTANIVKRRGRHPAGLFRFRRVYLLNSSPGTPGASFCARLFLRLG